MGMVQQSVGLYGYDQFSARPSQFSAELARLDAQNGAFHERLGNSELQAR
jgi:hypothetical protein